MKYNPIDIDGHHFSMYGEEEMICAGCSFVIWPTDNVDEIREQIKDDRDEFIYCGHSHHVGMNKDGKLNR
jgi:hypothetical protein